MEIFDTTAQEMRQWWLRAPLAGVIALTGLLAASQAAAQASPLRLPPPRELPPGHQAAPMPAPGATTNNGESRLPAPRNSHTATIPAAAPAPAPQGSVSLSDYLGNGSRTSSTPASRGREAAAFQSENDVIQRLLNYQNRPASETGSTRSVDPNRPLPGATPPLVQQGHPAAPPRSRWGQLPVPSTAPPAAEPVEMGLPAPRAAAAIASSYPNRRGGNILAGTDEDQVRLRQQTPATTPGTFERWLNLSAAQTPTPIPKESDNSPQTSTPASVAQAQPGYPYAWFAGNPPSDPRPATPPPAFQNPKPDPDPAKEALARLLQENQPLQDRAQEQVGLGSAPTLTSPPENLAAQEKSATEDRAPAGEPVMAGQVPRLPAPKSFESPEDNLPETPVHPPAKPEPGPATDTQAALREQLMERTRQEIRLAVTDAARRARTAE